MRLAFLRYSLVAFVSAVVAIATVGTAVYAHNDGFNERIVACFDSRDPNSDACRSALEVTPVGADFYTQLAANVESAPANPEPKPEPKPEPTSDLYSLMKACIQTKDLGSDECRQALDASGLSEADFKAKLAAKFGSCVTAMNNDGEHTCAKPVEKPVTKPVEKPAENTTEKPVATTASMAECLKLRETMRAGLTAKELWSKAERLYAVCAKARSESQMDAGEFWTKHR